MPKTPDPDLVDATHDALEAVVEAIRVARAERLASERTAGALQERDRILTEIRAGVVPLASGTTALYHWFMSIIDHTHTTGIDP